MNMIDLTNENLENIVKYIDGPAAAAAVHVQFNMITYIAIATDTHIYSN